MIVDDEIMIRLGMKTIIDWEKYGYKVVADAVNGKDALEKIEKYHPNVIFTDLAMDIMDGLELIEICREKYPDIVFVVISNYNDFENVRKAMKLGAFDYVLKLTIREENLKVILEEIDKQFPADNKQSMEMGKMIRKNQQAIKTRIIHMLEEKTYVSVEEVLEELKIIDVSVCLNQPFAILQFSIDNFDLYLMNGKISDVHLQHFAMDNIITELLSSDFVVEGFNYNEHELIYLIQTNVVSDYFVLYERIKPKFEIIKKYLKSYLNIEVTGVLSRICDGVEDIHLALKENKNILYQRLPSENGMLHMYNDGSRKEIRMIKEYIYNHFAEELSVEMAAKEVNMSRSYFSHIFKNHMKMGFTDYVNTVRISKACEMLHNPNIRIQEVSFAVGITNCNYFSILFKKLMGCSPNKYKESVLRKEDSNVLDNPIKE